MPEARLRLRAGTVCVHDSKVLLIKLKDPITHTVQLFPPGGGIEPHETPEQTALRETLEETGYRVRLDGPSVVKKYPFTWGGVRYDCTSYFFRASLESLDPLPPETSEIHMGVFWVPLSEVGELLSFDGFIQEAVLELLS